jgi:hypothetical protein
MKIITPGVFLVAALLSSACTDTDDIDTESDDPQPGTAECCAPTDPRATDPVYDSFSLGQRARDRFDWLRHARGK